VSVVGRLNAVPAQHRAATLPTHVDPIAHAPVLDRLTFTSIDLSAILESYGFSAVPPSFWHPYFGRQPGRMWPPFTKPTLVEGTTIA
jgi:hypothetical protein